MNPTEKQTQDQRIKAEQTRLMRKIERARSRVVKYSSRSNMVVSGEDPCMTEDDREKRMKAAESQVRTLERKYSRAANYELFTEENTETLVK